MNGRRQWRSQEGKNREKSWSLAGTAAIPALALISCVSFLLLLVSPLQAQELPTNTPDAQGIIYVEVQPDDSLWAIAARAGLTIPQLLELNELDESVVLRPGDLLQVARVTPPPTATSDIPTATLPPPSATPTIARPRTAVCMLAYNDADKDGILDEGENYRSNVAFTIYNEQEVVANYVSDGLSEPFCLEDLLPGIYHVTRSITKKETLTSAGDWAITLSEGSVLNLAFGSYDADPQVTDPTPDADQQLRTRLALTPQATPTLPAQAAAEANRGASLMLGLAIAAFVLLAGMAVLTFVIAYRRRTNTE